MELIGDVWTRRHRDRKWLFKFHHLNSHESWHHRSIIPLKINHHFSIKASNSCSTMESALWCRGDGDGKCETMEWRWFHYRQRFESTRSENDWEIMFQGLISKARKTFSTFSCVIFLFFYFFLLQLSVDDLRTWKSSRDYK